MAAKTRPSILMDKKSACRYLGRGENWLQSQAHRLFKPSVKPSNKKGRMLYHIDHLDIIVLHLIDPDGFTADAAYLAWRNRIDQRISDVSRNGQPSPRKRKRSERRA